MKNLVDKINENYNNMSKSQKKLANYILTQYSKAAFMTAVKLGEAVGLSESTVVRFAYYLGYDGYPQMQEEITALVQSKIGQMERVNLTPAARSEDENTFEKIFNSDAERVLYTKQNVEPEIFEKALDILSDAKRIFVIGIRGCKPVAELLAYNLKYVCENVICVTTSNSTELMEQLTTVGPNDAVVGISFPRYSIATIRALEYANAARASIITITDEKLSPINLYSSCVLTAKSDLTGLIESYTSCVSLINALSIMLYSRNTAKVKKIVSKLNKIYKAYKIGDGEELEDISGDILL